MEDTRPLKRARQACGPCRRKKSRCPGERPVCSYCQRLGQECIYNDQESENKMTRLVNRQMEQRLDNLEAQMTRLIEQFLPVATAAARREALPARTSTPGSLISSAEQWPARSAGPRRGHSPEAVDDEESGPFDPAASPAGTVSLRLDGAELLVAGEAYLTWCHSQPIVLFREETFLETLGARDQHLVLALQALGLRFPPGTLTPDLQERVTAMVNVSRGLAMNAVVNSQVELSTLQTLCLLSIIDFADGRPALAEMNIRVASGLADSIQPGYTLGDPQECSDCIRSIAMVQHLQGCVFNTRLSDTLAKSHNISLRPGVAKHHGTTRDAAWVLDGLPQTQLDKGILRYTYKLSEVWHMARSYAASVVASDAPPPWNAQSDYSSVMQRHLEIDSMVPLRYRFYANRFSDKTPESMQEQRHYWSPYFFLQIIYATIPCLLNHPFLLSMRLRNFRQTMPQAFIHQSFELITRHAGWIMYFIDTVGKKSMQLSDPTLAHCAVIIATIHLQHSFVQEQGLRDRSQAGFEKCANFLRNMGTMWPSAAVMLENLRLLRESVVADPLQSMGDGSTSVERPCLSIDSKLLWNMLIYERAGRHCAGLDQSIFGSSLTQVQTTERRGEAHETLAAAYDLVGFAGISGHKTVPKESPVYAPEENTTLGETSNVAEGPGIAPTTQNSFQDRYIMCLDGESSFEPLFLQAHEFGRAIEEWMSL